MLRPDRLRWTGLCALVVLGGCSGAEAEPEGTAEATVEPVNSLPNPYERIEPWARLPEGMDAWPSVIGVEPGPDGNLYVLHRCFETSCAGRPEAPIVKYDMSGTPMASWGVGMFVYTHGSTWTGTETCGRPTRGAKAAWVTRSSSSVRTASC